MHFKGLSTLTLIIGLTASTSFSWGQKKWTLDKENSEVTFKILGEDDKGSLDGMEADITFSPDALDGSSFEAKIPVKTIDTGIEQRDDHLKQDDYFHVEKHPHIHFKSTEVIKTESGYMAKGDLTIRGNTKKVNMPFVWEADKKRFVGRLEIQTKDFEVGDYNIAVRIVAAVK